MAISEDLRVRRIERYQSRYSDEQFAAYLESQWELTRSLLFSMSPLEVSYDLQRLSRQSDYLLALLDLFEQGKEDEADGLAGAMISDINEPLFSLDVDLTTAEGREKTHDKLDHYMVQLEIIRIARIFSAVGQTMPAFYPESERTESIQQANQAFSSSSLWNQFRSLSKGSREMGDLSPTSGLTILIRTTEIDHAKSLIAQNIDTFAAALTKQYRLGILNDVESAPIPYEHWIADRFLNPPPNLEVLISLRDTILRFLRTPQEWTVRREHHVNTLLSQGDDYGMLAFTDGSSENMSSALDYVSSQIVKSKIEVAVEGMLHKALDHNGRLIPLRDVFERVEQDLGVNLPARFLGRAIHPEVLEKASESAINHLKHAANVLRNTNAVTRESLEEDLGDSGEACIKAIHRLAKDVLEGPYLPEQYHGFDGGFQRLVADIMSGRILSSHEEEAR